MIKIRLATKRDFEIVQKLNYLLFKREQKLFDSTLNIDWPFEEGVKYFQKMINSKNSLVLIAENNDGQAIGYLIGKLAEINKSRIVHKRSILDNMFVLKKYRNQGVGQELVQKFIAWSKKKKVENIRVTAFARNNKALQFYRQQGFKDYNLTLEINL